MTMNAMVEYLDKRGFKAEKEYTPRDRRYKFTISKGGKETSAFYTYSPYVPAHKVNTIQKQFLDDLIERWHDYYGEEKKTMTTNAKENDMNRNNVNNALCQAASDILTKEIHMKHNIINEDTLIDAAMHSKTGILQINGASVPVRLTSLKQSTWELSKIECDVLDPFGEDARKFSKNMLNSKFGSKVQPGLQIKDVIFSPPATIVKWKDGTKTVVKADGEDYDPEKGLAMAISKKVLGNNYSYYNTFKKWLKKAPQ